jgi:hypothetical protein
LDAVNCNWGSDHCVFCSVIVVLGNVDAMLATLQALFDIAGLIWKLLFVVL